MNKDGSACVNNNMSTNGENRNMKVFYLQDYNRYVFVLPNFVYKFILSATNLLVCFS